MFCVCGSMMFARKGVYICNSCGATRKIQEKAQVIRTEGKDKETAVVINENDNLPKTFIKPPNLNRFKQN